MVAAVTGGRLVGGAVRAASDARVGVDRPWLGDPFGQYHLLAGQPGQRFENGDPDRRRRHRHQDGADAERWVADHDQGSGRGEQGNRQDHDHHHGVGRVGHPVPRGRGAGRLRHHRGQRQHQHRPIGVGRGRGSPERLWAAGGGGHREHQVQRDLQRRRRADAIRWLEHGGRRPLRRPRHDDAAVGLSHQHVLRTPVLQLRRRLLPARTPTAASRTTTRCRRPITPTTAVRRSAPSW